LAELRKKLAAARLVSLVGPGGVGKTRLAIRAASELGRSFSGGAWLVELTDVRDPALVPLEEQVLLRRLRVFAGRFTIEDAEGIAGRGELLDLLSSLVDKSLVMKEDAGGTAVYRLHETLRA
jgi:predicted ATPase